jgi:lactate racemase
MNLSNVEITFGASRIAFQVPETFLAGEVVKPRALPSMPIEQIRSLLAGAMAEPVGRPRLRDAVNGKKVAVLVSDEFRAGLHEVIIEAIANELGAGTPREVVFVCATGTHEPEVYAARIGPWVERYCSLAGLSWRFVAHSCDDPRLVSLGPSPLGTEIRVEKDMLDADVRVYGHESKHHYMNGYSVVDKQVTPGISSRRTVEMNHRRSLSSNSGPGRSPWHTDPARQENPFAQDARDIRHVVEQSFLLENGTIQRRKSFTFGLDMISDKDSIYWTAAGDPDLLCALAVQKADEQAEIRLAKTRYLLISPGGPPASQALYGVQNCFDMAMLGAVEKGGEVLVVAPCDGRPDLPPDVRGIATSKGSKKLFWDNLVRLQDQPIEACFEDIDSHFELYMWKTYRVLRNQKVDRLKIFVYSQLPPETVRQGGFIPVSDPQAWIQERADRGDGKLRVIDNGNKLFIVGA